MSLVPVPSEQDRASCPNCSAPLAADQRYCLACGQPVSPVRLAFLDVLQADAQPYAQGQGSAGSLPAGYAPVIEPASGASGWLRRYAGVLGLFAVLLLAVIIGLLVGHWVTQSKAPAGTQVVRVEGLTSASPAAAAGSAAAGASATKASTSSTTTKPAKTSAKTEAKEVKEAKAIEKAPAPKAVKVAPAKLQKLGSTTGKKHEEEINKLGSQPIETG